MVPCSFWWVFVVWGGGEGVSVQGFLSGGLYPEGSVKWGLCLEGPSKGGGGSSATAAGGTHPTGMHPFSTYHCLFTAKLTVAFLLSKTG